MLNLLKVHMLNLLLSSVPNKLPLLLLIDENTTTVLLHTDFTQILL